MSGKEPHEQSTELGNTQGLWHSDSKRWRIVCYNVLTIKSNNNPVWRVTDTFINVSNFFGP